MTSSSPAVDQRLTNAAYTHALLFLAVLELTEEADLTPKSGLNLDRDLLAASFFLHRITGGR